MNLYFITDHSAIFKAFKQVVETLLEANAQLVVPNDYPFPITNAQDIIVIEGNDQSIIKWLWNDIRKKYLNPVVALGSSPEKTFLKNNPIFRNGMSQYHRYLEPPWLLNRFFSALEQTVPLHDDDTRQLIFDRYGTPYVEDRLYRLIDHDLKLFDIQKDLAVLDEALKYADESDFSKLQDKLREAILLRKANNIQSVQQIKSDLLILLKEGVGK